MAITPIGMVAPKEVTAPPTLSPQVQMSEPWTVAQSPWMRVVSVPQAATRRETHRTRGTTRARNLLGTKGPPEMLGVDDITPGTWNRQVPTAPMGRFG